VARVLVIDDDPGVSQAISLCLTKHGHAVNIAGTGDDGVRAFAAGGFDLVLLDLQLPDLDGIQVFERLRMVDSGAIVVFLTAHGTVESAVTAMKAGAFDYLRKPFDNDNLLFTIARAAERRRLAERVQTLEQEVEGRTSFPDIIGRSEAIRSALRLLAKAAGTPVTVLLLGESGTGKELAARGLHRESPRSKGPFLAVNCGAIAGTLADSLLFGHERGAFTGAHTRHAGHFESAHGGTIFFDEVGELPPELQAKLLRVLQERTVLRIGSSQPISVDVRIVAATNRDLEVNVKEGRFRQDLFYRLNQFPIRMPALRERPEDIPLLVRRLVAKFNADLGRQVEGASAELLERLVRHDWPGNVRELENVIRWAMMMASGPNLTEADLHPEALRPPADAGTTDLKGIDEALKVRAERAERAAIQAALEAHGGNRDRTAGHLGITRKTLYNKMKKYDLL